MTLKDGKEHGMLTGGLFKFWGADWPDPGGTEFQAEVYDASGPDGAPGSKIAGPFKLKRFETENGPKWISAQKESRSERIFILCSARRNLTLIHLPCHLMTAVRTRTETGNTSTAAGLKPINQTETL